MKMSEFDLVIAVRDKRAKVSELTDTLKNLKQDLAETEYKLIEALNAEGKESSARYEGVGFVSLSKPQLFASYLKENEENVFKFLQDSERSDLIKPTVHAKSLSSYVSELIESGKSVPSYINYYLKPTLKFYER